jgi:hypothetical protein
VLYIAKSHHSRAEVSSSPLYPVAIYPSTVSVPAILTKCRPYIGCCALRQDHHHGFASTTSVSGAAQEGPEGLVHLVAARFGASCPLCTTNCWHPNTTRYRSPSSCHSSRSSSNSTATMRRAIQTRSSPRFSAASTPTRTRSRSPSTRATTSSCSAAHSAHSFRYARPWHRP